MPRMTVDQLLAMLDDPPVAHHRERLNLMACQIGIKVPGMYRTELGGVCYVPAASSREAFDLESRQTLPMDLVTPEYLGPASLCDLPVNAAGV